MFWGFILESQKKYVKVLENSFCVTMATLDTEKSSSDLVAVCVEINKIEYILCFLQASCMLQKRVNLHFTAGEEVAFFLKGGGVGVVHLTGYILPEDNDFSDEASLSGEDDDTLLHSKNKANEGAIAFDLITTTDLSGESAIRKNELTDSHVSHSHLKTSLPADKMKKVDMEKLNSTAKTAEVDRENLLSLNETAKLEMINSRPVNTSEGFDKTNLLPVSTSVELGSRKLLPVDAPLEINGETSLIISIPAESDSMNSLPVNTVAVLDTKNPQPVSPSLELGSRKSLPLNTHVEINGEISLSISTTAEPNSMNSMPINTVAVLDTKTLQPLNTTLDETGELQNNGSAESCDLKVEKENKLSKGNQIKKRKSGRKRKIANLDPIINIADAVNTKKGRMLRSKKK